MTSDQDGVGEGSGRQPFEAAAARIVLADCHFLLSELRDDPTGTAWRVRWVSTLTLLRAVGHVLRNVDADKKRGTPEIVQAIHDWWQTIKDRKPEPKIFWGFIEQQRNELLKEYRFSEIGHAAEGVHPLLFIREQAFSERSEQAGAHCQLRGTSRS